MVSSDLSHLACPCGGNKKQKNLSNYAKPAPPLYQAFYSKIISKHRRNMYYIFLCDNYLKLSNETFAL